MTAQRLRPVVIFSNRERSVWLRPDQRDAYASRDGRRGRRKPDPAYDIDQAPWWVMVAQELQPTPLERLVLEQLARLGEITIAPDRRSVDAKIQRR